MKHLCGLVETKRVRIRLVAAWAALLCAFAAAAQTPQHVMSLSMCTDAMLLDLLPPNRIASITFLSRDASNSFLWPQAAKVPINYGSAEEVLAERPDFVLAGTYTTPATRHADQGSWVTDSRGACRQQFR